MDYCLQHKDSNAMKHSSLRTPLAQVKGLGSAKDGTSHFIHQRVTAIALIPLSLWFVCSILGLVTSNDPSKLAAWLYSGVNASVLILMLIALFYHAKLGMQVVIEDYVHCSCIKITALLGNTFFMYGAALLSILAVLKLHLHL
jgi:succinate dehydrogenase / fumarate reductase, membrane anchor subunit